ncbi:MAG: CRISPR-associated endonuclease/helicase Cas3 [Bacillota bacterium]|nr:CRISPR-associated endonuclease/helicase Cas3 [Bacillota bacterium]MDN5364946.1 CRISPR-associated endonuclease/helicase Cas3 [Thermacetogenium sp.]
MDEFTLLGKPDTPLLVHLREVTEQGRILVQRLGLSSELKKRAVLACAFHDLGKATNSFQAHVRGRRGKAYPHALASLPFVLVAELRAFKMQPLAAAAVVSHHSPLGPEVYKGYRSPDYHGELSAFLESLWEYLREVGLEEVLPFLEECLLFYHRGESPAALLDASLPLESTRKSLRGVFKELPPKDFADVKAVLHLADWLASSKEQQAAALFLQQGKEAVSAFIRGKAISLRTFQQKASEHWGNRLWLRAPTGTGKTEALLLWAGDTERLLYLLPTQATANAMWRRLRKIYGEEKVGLAHGKAGYILRKESEEDPLDLRLFASVFAKPVVVGTLDQYLLAHLHGRHWEERRALARRATVVLDEIHSYDPYTLGLLLEALAKEPPARLALASATLPQILMELFGSGPLLEAEGPLWERRRHRLHLRSEALDDALEEILSSAGQGKTVLVIANTVRRAQGIYQALRERGGKRVHLLHSRFAFRDRQKKEEQLEQAEPGTILVATQIVEVSLDISYDSLFTEVAPVDALVQRMGRVNRKGTNSAAPVFVFQQWDEGSEKIYGREILTWSWDLLNELPALPSDRDWVAVTNRLYEELASTRSYQQDMEEGRKTLREVQEILGCYTIDLSDEEMRAKFTTRRGQLSLEVLPGDLKDEAFEFMERNERWRIVELLVPVPIYWLAAFSEWFSPLPDLGCFLTELPYSKEIGLAPPGKEEAPSGMEMW